MVLIHQMIRQLVVSVVKSAMVSYNWFRCGKRSHKMRDCPNLKSQTKVVAELKQVVLVMLQRRTASILSALGVSKKPLPMWCPISLHNRVSYVNLVELDILDIDIILGTDWLNTCVASINCRTGVVRFNFQNEHVFVWKRGNSIPRGCIISCLKTCKIISKVCLYDIIRIRDLDSKLLFIKSIPCIERICRVFS